MTTPSFTADEVQQWSSRLKDADELLCRERGPIDAIEWTQKAHAALDELIQRRAAWTALREKVSAECDDEGLLATLAFQDVLAWMDEAVK
jgi:hypothetical protein